jgi:DNA polymerase III subunit delta
VTAAGGVVDTSVGRGRERSQWLGEQLRHAPVRMDAAAARRLEAHLGDDLGRLTGLLETVSTALGEGAMVTLADLEPFLGEAGAVPPWELTDAVDAGDTAGALSALHRMMGAGGRPALHVLNTLHSHFSNVLRLDGAAVASGEEAASVLGTRSTFVAKKALARARELGSERVGEAIILLADADLDLKGRTALPPEMVLEVLVARLSRLGRARARGPGARTGRSGARNR